MDSRKTYMDLIFAWMLVDFALPVFVIAIFWPIVAFFLKKTYAFDRVFHTADLMPLGAILLLAAIRELETESRLGRIKAACAKRRMLGTVIAIVFLFMYAICKYYSLTTAIPDKTGESIDTILSLISYLSIATIVFCGLYSLFIKSSIYRNIGVS